jgi:hypothetical protein
MSQVGMLFVDGLAAAVPGSRARQQHFRLNHADFSFSANADASLLALNRHATNDGRSMRISGVLEISETA